MLDALLLALAAAQSAPAPAAPDIVDDTFTLVGGAGTVDAAHSLVARIGPSTTLFLAIACVRGRRPDMSVMVQFRHTIGFDVAGLNSGGFRLHTGFDGGRNGWWRASAAGDAALLEGPYSGARRFLRRLKGTRSLNLRIRREGGGEQEVTYNYPDPTEVIDEAARRCGIALDD